MKKGCCWIFQQDNDPKHRSKKNIKYLDTKKKDLKVRLCLLDWPSQSPDLNPLENLWGIVKWKLKTSPRHASIVDELWEMVKNEWTRISPDTTNTLIESMPERIQEVLKNGGRHSHF